MKNNYIIAGILIIIPFIVLAAIPLYNFNDPVVAGFPFFIWFQILWLVLSAILFAIAAYFIDKEEVAS